MLEYFSYQKLKKHQAAKAAREGEAEAAPANDSSTTKPQNVALPDSSGDVSPAVYPPEPVASSSHEQQAHNIPRKPLPVLTREDEDFLRNFVGDGDAAEDRPPLPVRPSVDNMHVAGDSTGNDQQVVPHEGKENQGYAAGIVGGIKQRLGKGKGKEVTVEDEVEEHKEAKKEGKLGFIGRTFSKKEKKPETSPVITPEEAANEKDDINRVLEDLNLTAVNNRAFSISAESQVFLQKFTLILKDLANGVPTAYDDLTHLLDTSQDTLEKNYENLPGFLKKLVMQLPTKLTAGLAPELLAVASEAQGLNAAGASTAAGFGAAAKNFLTPTSLKDLVTKPGAVMSMLKSIMNVLKLRWPAFMGTNVLLSLGLFVLLFVFWYCHKRGREERLKRESGAQLVDSEGRIIELDDDPMLEPGTSTGPTGTQVPLSSADRSRSQSRSRQANLAPQGSAREVRESSGSRRRSKEEVVKER